MKKPLKRLSQYVGIPASEFLKKGLFNPSVDGDTDLFIDPRLLHKSKFKIFKEYAVNAYNLYYEELAKKIKLILKVDNNKTKEKMKINLTKELSAPDLEGLMLGYAGHHLGRGATGTYARAIMNNALEISWFSKSLFLYKSSDEKMIKRKLIIERNDNINITLNN